MSNTSLIPFKGRLPQQGIEFRNSFGGAARIWTALFDQFLKDPKKPYDSWIMDKSDKLWELAQRTDIPMPLRAVHAFTFDHCYVRREHFARFAADLRLFFGVYPTRGMDHLKAWADIIEKSDEEAFGLWGTSVNQNPWIHYVEAEDKCVAKPLSEGWEIYDWLERVDREKGKAVKPSAGE